MPCLSYILKIPRRSVVDMDIVNLLYFFRTYLRGIHHTRIRQGQMNHK